MDPENMPNTNTAIIYSTIAGICGAIIAGCLTSMNKDATTGEVLRNALIGGGLAPVFLYAAVAVLDRIQNRDN